MTAVEAVRLARRDSRIVAMLEDAIRIADAGEMTDGDALRIVRAQMDGTQ